MSDLISRQAAIGSVIAYNLEDEGDMASLVMILQNLPSAQPESTEQIKWERDTAVEQLKELGYGLGEKIIHCKDCKHYQFADNRAFGMPVKMCKWFGFEDVDDDDFCSRAEPYKGEQE